MPEGKTPRIYVLAGANGAGKSSVAGAMFEQSGAGFFNPDEAARQILAANPGLSLTQANSAAWHQGKRLLEKATLERLDFAFESTLGASTIPALLQKAAGAGIEVRIWYVALSSPELHIERVRARVARGGHDIPEAKIRERYATSRQNLIRLLPDLTELRMYDNSDEGDPAAGVAPKPRLILHWERGRIVSTCPLDDAPLWARPILAAAMERDGK